MGDFAIHQLEDTEISAMIEALFCNSNALFQQLKYKTSIDKRQRSSPAANQI